jgi:hypothetical protein
MILDRDLLYRNHECVECCFNGFEKNTCNIDVVMPTNEGVIVIAKNVKIPKVCPMKIHKKIIIMDERKVTNA